MNSFYAYTRVSTVRQGDGVSLEAQKDAIQAFADRHNLTISKWFEEKETAAKQGRPVFNAVVKALQERQANGLIVHKIDRSARNFADWAKIGELLDAGLEVHFAHESLDLTSRGGRLTADIQAVIAADYVRNLREECVKGMHGRLKQGLFPWAAPIGYLDQGGGKAKVADPVRAPFVRMAFELYASQKYSFRGLLRELQKRGFKNRSGKPVTKGCLENIMSNPFYCGTIRIKRTGATFAGIHEPLISKALFQRVQDLKANKQQKKETKHNHTYRRFIECGTCRRYLCGELQKDRVYYRCHHCRGVGIREDRLEAAMRAELQGLSLSDKHIAHFKERAQQMLATQNVELTEQSINLQLAQLAERDDRLTDALIDGLIDKQTCADRRFRLEVEREKLEAGRHDRAKNEEILQIFERFLELSKNLYLQYELAKSDQKLRLAQILLSNCMVHGNQPYISTHNWVKDPQNMLSVLCGPPHRDGTRIFRDHVGELIRLVFQIGK